MGWGEVGSVEEEDSEGVGSAAGEDSAEADWAEAVGWAAEGLAEEDSAEEGWAEGAEG